MKLISSNIHKLNEYQRYGLINLTLEKGKDVKEVDAEPLTVILYKSKEVGKGTLVEDTSLHVKGAELGANIRWNLNQVSTYNGSSATWEVLIGENDGKYINVYQGLIHGTITNRFNEPVGFGFDCYFIPEGETLTLFELEQKGLKDSFSARKKAIQSYLKKEFIHRIPIDELPIWNGQYQS
jgi:XTP/dITP diphosphohydrolase